MRRVLARGGRLALSVWNSVGLYNSAVGEALARFVGNEAAVRFCASRQVPTKEELQRLATEAGFSAVDVRVSRINVHLPRLDQFTLDHLAATPVAPVIAAADPEAREKIGASVMEAAAALCRRRWGDLSGRNTCADGSRPVTIKTFGKRRRACKTFRNVALTATCCGGTNATRLMAALAVHVARGRLVAAASAAGPCPVLSRATDQDRRAVPARRSDRRRGSADRAVALVPDLVRTSS